RLVTTSRCGTVRTTATQPSGALVVRYRQPWKTLASVLVLSLCAGMVQAADKPRVALVMKSLENECFQTMQQGARAHQAAHAADYELLSTGIKDEIDTA